MKLNKKIIIVFGILALFIFWSIAQSLFLPWRLSVLSSKLKGSFSSPDEMVYGIKMMGIPAGKVVFKKAISQEDGTKQAVLDIVPPRLISWISGNGAGVQLKSIINNKNDLPLSFEQRSFRRIKKGKTGRVISYDHDKLSMERRGYINDILPDTRDPLSVFVWLMDQKQESLGFVKSSMNIDGSIWLVVGKGAPLSVKKLNSINKINMNFIKINKAYTLKERDSCTIYFLLRENFNLPLMIRWYIIPVLIPVELELIP